MGTTRVLGGQLKVVFSTLIITCMLSLGYRDWYPDYIKLKKIGIIRFQAVGRN